MTPSDDDWAALESYLSAELDDPVVDTEVLHDGLNLTVGITTAGGERYVLRRPQQLRHTDLFNDLDVEYRVLERLAGTALPTPEPVLFCEDASVLGDRFFVTTYLDGEAVPMGSSLTDRFPGARARARLAEEFVDALAGIHAVDREPFEGVCDRHAPTEQVERELDRLDQATGVTGRECTALREVGDWLLENPPADPETTLVHGDFKPGNLFVSGHENPAVTGVLDWETALLGDPRSELGYFLLYWRDEGDPTPSVDDVEARYPDAAPFVDLRETDRDGFYPFTTLPGSPTRRDLVDRWEAATGITFEDDRFYRAHAALGLATVWEDLHRHQVDAGAESHYEPLADYVALTAKAIVDGEFEL